MIHEFLEMDTGAQLAFLAKLTADERARLKEEFEFIQEKKRYENRTSIKFKLARQFSEDTMDIMSRRKGK